jgi:hypothetical protein
VLSHGRPPRSRRGRTTTSATCRTTPTL